MKPSPTIAVAEVLALRLVVSPAALGQAVEDAALDGLVLEPGPEPAVVLGRARLAFRGEEDGLVATALRLEEDTESRFTLGFLTPLFRRHRGDLHLKLRFTDGGGRELRLVSGRAAPTPPAATPPATREPAPAPDAEARASETASPSGPALTSAEERDIRRLLEEARRHWEEYQRLKAEARRDDAP